jgi:DAK2 domain fusion protein YloV
VLDALDADAVRRWSRSAVDLLAAHRAEIDAINVYPVPDSDTGSNLLTTLQAGEAALAATRTPSAGAALAALAVGAARGALGNSGFIVSQILRGLADSTDSQLDAPAVAVGLDRGAVLARTAVVSPVEGTILTVARAAADGARGRTLAEVVVNALRAADGALQRTPTQLADLAQAGVVDAGGRGLVVLLDALACVVTGESQPLQPIRVPAYTSSVAPPGDSGFGFEVQYHLDAPAAAVDDLRHALSAVGDSIAVVSLGDETWNVHAHVNDVGAAIEAGMSAGRPREISVVRFADHDHVAGARGASAVVAVSPGAGLAHLFEAEGVRVVEAAAGAVPSVDDVVSVINSAGARELVLLPNASRITGVAEAAAERFRAHGVRVSVVPTRSPVQGLAAIAVHDAARHFDDDVVAMAEAAAATRFAELTIARGEALTAVGICQPGDILGLIDGEVVEIGRGLLAVAFNIVDRLLAVGAELLTVLVGAEAPPRTGALVEAHVRERSPLTDVMVYDGGQADYPVIIGVE